LRNEELCQPKFSMVLIIYLFAEAFLATHYIQKYSKESTFCSDITSRPDGPASKFVRIPQSLKPLKCKNRPGKYKVNFAFYSLALVISIFSASSISAQFFST
jgi:hypothetical protein